MRRLLVLLVLVGLAACSSPKKPVEEQRIDGVRTFADLAHTHVAGPVTYPQTPPAGGPHHPLWLKCAVYDEPVKNENAVHSMEHGGVWITYRPDLPADQVARLRDAAALRPGAVLMSPYPGLPGPVFLSAWGLQLGVDSATDPRVAAFVERYAGGNQGGEARVGCAEAPLPAGSGSPTAPAM